MDTYGQIGPEKDDYAADCFVVGRQLFTEVHAVHVTLAAAMTAHHLVLTPLLAVRNFGSYDTGIGPYNELWDEEAIYPTGSNGQRRSVKRLGHNGYLLVTRTNQDGPGAYWFDTRSWHACSFVWAKLNLRSRPDAVAIAAFLHRVQHAANLMRDTDALTMAAWSWADYASADTAASEERFAELTGFARP
jgi:hypothetical protein